jgi:hypothetical protein
MDRLGILTVVIVGIVSFILGMVFLALGSNDWNILTRVLFLVGQWIVGCVIYVIIQNAP